MDDKQEPLSENPFASPQASSEPLVVERETDEPVEPINPWLGMWLQPRHTMRYLLQQPSYRLPQLVVVYLIAASLAYGGNLLVSSSGNISNTIADAIGVFVGILIGGGIAWAIYGGMLHFSARRFRGEGVFDHTMAAVAWSQVPVIFSFVLMLPLHASEALLQGVAGGDWFSFQLIKALVPQFFYLWSLVTLSHGLGVAHHFSSWKGAGTLLLAFIILLALAAAFFVTCITLFF